MLAGPILALGLPTHGAAEYGGPDGGARRRGRSARAGAGTRPPGRADQRRTGTGIDAIERFLLQHGSNHSEFAKTLPVLPIELPVLQNPGACRRWAAQVSTRTNYKAPASPLWTRRLDSVLLHRVWGPLIFLAVVIAVFQVVFTIGQPLQRLAGQWPYPARHACRAAAIPIPWLQALVHDGLWNGVQAVLVFLPQILLLFLFIGMLEDSGYLARAALIADRADALHRAQRQGVHPAALGLRVRCAGDHGHAHHREQARPDRHHPDRAVHDLLGAAADLHADHRGVHSRIGRMLGQSRRHARVR